MDKKSIAAVLAIAALYAAMMALGITCPIKLLTGVSCAGCGMSRAWLCLLRGDVAGAYAYHPLFWLPAPAAAGFLCRNKLPPAVCRWGGVAVCVLFLGVYAVRLFTPGDAVVVFEPTQGLLFRLFAGGFGR